MKVLVGTITDNRKEHIRKEFFDSIYSLTAKPDFHIIDTSDSEKDDMETIVQGRNQLRDVFLKGDYDYFLSVDSDVITPIDTIERLLAHNKDIVSFKIHFKKAEQEVPQAFEYRFDKGVKIYTWKELESQRLLKVWGGSLGIALIKKIVLKSIKFRCPDDNGEDYWFMRDLEGKFEWYLDTSVRVKHYN